MTLDSNIIIAYLAGEKDVVELIIQWRKEGRPLFLSTVVESEVLSYSLWADAKRAVAVRFLEENFISIPFDRLAARYAASLRTKIKIKFPDAAIATTALMNHTPLVTRNVGDFKKIPGLEIITP